MNWPEIESAILEHFNLSWNDRTPISYPNVQLVKQDNESFVQIMPVYLEPDISLGKIKIYNNLGYIFFCINISKNTGSGEASDLQKAISDIFSSGAIPSIVFGNPKFHQQKNSKSYKKYIFIIPWSCEETVDIIAESSIHILTSALNSWSFNSKTLG